ncbi:uncharacterized protein F4807DRAFT_352988 [Annulohypoxylon truncatum]|uniref:uncharacterized protein n=1 Tax=Annulohypoxylon truncatum TaxID=327061 RepID=UPI002008AAB7|nr:uncharacterized protein F4807DRAFT_352988 [Annulohypoxylon truncatum]KAI1212851.1 hypothetical protein F4807DRAFT_352988 [Annulohypoxylon truncatum]
MHLPPTNLMENISYAQMGLMHVDDSSILNPYSGFAEVDLPQLSLAPDENQSQSDDGILLDTQRLQTQHTTEGYRDGIIAGKAESIQIGFDEGFDLGANLGLKAGRILGLIEGVATALNESGHHSSAYIDQLLSNAAEELSTDSIFSEKYWASDGTWKYLVVGSTTEGDILLEDVANEHPAIMKWEAVINEEVIRWSIDQNLPILGDNAFLLEGEESSVRQTPLRPSVDW